MPGRVLPQKLGGVLGVKKHILKSSTGGQNTKDTSGGELGQFLGQIEQAGPKFGFIQCPDLAEQGQDSKVFILADELRQYKAGQTVKFTAYLDGQGRLQGKDLKSGLKDNPNFTPKQNFAGQKNIVRKDTSGGVIGEFLGMITQIGPKFGFIESIGAPLGKVFVLADELRQYKEGHKVRFTAYMDSQGRLQGKDLKSGLKGGFQQDFSMMGGLGDLFQGASGPTAAKPINKKDTSGGVLGQFLGTIDSVGPKFGFIESPDLAEQGQDSKVFVLSDELRQYKQGHKVKFTAYLDGQGRLQGKDLKSGLK